MKKPELLAPAGNLEKLKFAVIYGADAVYLGGKNFGLRAFAGNFELDQINEGVKFAHRHGVKVYITVNIFPHNEDLKGLPQYLEELQKINVDAIICSDPGVIKIAKETTPLLPIHLSTQANNVNWASAQFWSEQGVERIVMARELSLEEIIEIKKRVAVEIETFIHGAMCISYSGRCLLSNYMADRDANRGECAQACRWNYNLVEEKRPGKYYPIIEDERGTYVFNSQDLCLFEHMKLLIDAGIDSFKIEGRMKSVYYVATVVRAYRKIIDYYFSEQKQHFNINYWREELEKVSHRPYTTGFYFGKPEDSAATLESSNYIRPYDFVGVVLDYEETTGIATIEQRNRFHIGERIEFFGPHGNDFSQVITEIVDEEGNYLETAPHPRQILKIPVKQRVFSFDLLRREKIDE
ncbi:MAG: family peptidase [Clostridia bacterium]|nr:family peptidase [Clostridia bacterium]MDN5323166.1 family peptidase [Clostridia bacterium]